LFPLVETGPPVAAAMIHGVIPSLDTSAIWASQNMSYPDNFLHLVIIIKWTRFSYTKPRFVSKYHWSLEWLADCQEEKKKTPL
jgi:hypothetical protein